MWFVWFESSAWDPDSVTVQCSLYIYKNCGWVIYPFIRTKIACVDMSQNDVRLEVWQEERPFMRIESALAWRKLLLTVYSALKNYDQKNHTLMKVKRAGPTVNHISGLNTTIGRIHAKLCEWIGFWLKYIRSGVQKTSNIHNRKKTLQLTCDGSQNLFLNKIHLTSRV